MDVWICPLFLTLESEYLSGQQEVKSERMQNGEPEVAEASLIAMQVCESEGSQHKLLFLCMHRTTFNLLLLVAQNKASCESYGEAPVIALDFWRVKAERQVNALGRVGRP